MLRNSYPILNRNVQCFVSLPTMNGSPNTLSCAQESNRCRNERPPGPSGSSFSRPGHLVIVLRKPRQLSATDWIGEAIGQRSAFLSATVPTLRACERRLASVLAPQSGAARGIVGEVCGDGRIKATASIPTST